MKPYQKKLNTYYHRGYCSDDELADLLGCSSKRISEIRKGNMELWAWELLVLQSYFSEANRHDLADLSFPENYRMYQLKEMKLNGTWKDESRRCIRAVVFADEHASKNESEEALSYIEQARLELDQMETEIKSNKS